MQFIRMDTAFAKVFGYHITVEEGYRSLYWQKHWYAQYGAPRAAYPGTSNHGMGLAVDIRSGAGSPFTFGTAADTWLTANGAGSASTARGGSTRAARTPSSGTITSSADGYFANFPGMSSRISQRARSRGVECPHSPLRAGWTEV